MLKAVRLTDERLLAMIEDEQTRNHEKSATNTAARLLAAKLYELREERERRQRESEQQRPTATAAA